ncbi:MAG TPA: DUF1641 domain-containing protein [Steroidobacteraceae bacterium]|nr:DUF1641 domain-containing protein [Steroidobacteraceae bacterium]HRX89271.1 DUF1641 domain-containing protein [Steroidobacteraceae bacterium]
MNTQLAYKETLNSLLQNDPQLNDPATLEGISSLLGKLAPLVQGQRLHNLVDLLSALSDVVDMTDDAMVQKMMRTYEDLAAGAFSLANLSRFAAAHAGSEEQPPTAWQALRRLNSDADARRGLAMMLAMLSQLGRQARLGAMALPED